MRSPTWHIAFLAAVRSESVPAYDRAAKIANEVAGDTHRRELDAAARRIVDLEHEVATLRAETDDDEDDDEDDGGPPSGTHRVEAELDSSGAFVMVNV